MYQRYLSIIKIFDFMHFGRNILLAFYNASKILTKVGLNYENGPQSVSWVFFLAVLKRKSFT